LRLDLVQTEGRARLIDCVEAQATAPISYGRSCRPTWTTHSGSVTDWQVLRPPA